MMNKTNLRILMLGLIITCFPLTSYALDVNLTDLPPDNRYYKAVSVFMMEDIIEGYEDNTFKPEKEINRAEALKIILEAFKLENSSQAELNFEDISADDWFAKYVAVGLNKGIVKGYEDGTFKPGDQVNFAEALKMGLEAKGINTEELTYNDFHPDIEDGQWFSGLFSFGYDKNVFELNSDGSLNPGKPLSRGEFTELIYRIRDLPSNGEFDISYNWKSHSGRSAVEIQLPVEWFSFDFGGNGILIGNNFKDREDKVSKIDRRENETRGILYMTGINQDLTADDYFLEIKNELNGNWQYYEEAKLDGKLLIASNDERGEMKLKYWVEPSKVIIGEAKYSPDSLKYRDYKKIYRKLFRLAVSSDAPGVASIQERLNEVRKNLLVEGEGKETIELFFDKQIIETDVVGVGTGPIDYYYIPVIDYTLKYEREADVILDMMEGETFNF